MIMCDDMGMDLGRDISSTHCNAQKGVKKYTIYVFFKAPFSTALFGK
jgi:hypothetical protein